MAKLSPDIHGGTAGGQPRRPYVLSLDGDSSRNLRRNTIQSTPLHWSCYGAFSALKISQKRAQTSTNDEDVCVGGGGYICSGCW